ncbi:MAG: hypothetical protein ACPLGZ_00045 [Candidatus Pelagibacter ubique]
MKGGDSMADLREKLEEKKKEKNQNSAIFWRPNPGDVLEGTVKDIGTTITSFGESDYIDVITDQNQIVTVWMNSVLKHLIKKEGVRKGDRIAIEFLGVRSSKTKKKGYKDYILVVEHQEQENQEDE